MRLRILSILLAVLSVFVIIHQLYTDALSWRRSLAARSKRDATATHGRSDKVAKAYQAFRNTLDPKQLSLTARQAMFEELCSVSYGPGACSTLSPECQPVPGTTGLPYGVWSNSTSHSGACSRKITASLPVTLEQLPLLLAFAHTFKLQTPSESSLWDVVWIVAPAEEVVPIFEAVEKANLLHSVFRFVSQDVVFRERPQEKSYRGWHLQQDLKLALAWAARTDFVLSM